MAAHAVLNGGSDPMAIVTICNRLMARIALCLTACSLPAHAAPDRELYTIDWDIVPHTTPAGADWVAPFSSFVEGRMLPKAEFQIEAPIVRTNGTRVAEPSSLIAVTNYSKPLGCQLTLLGEKEIQPYNSKRNVVLGCFLDSDADGAFDQFFDRSLFIGDFRWNQSLVPKKTEPIAPVRYRRQPFTRAINGIPIYIQYSHFASGIDRLIFDICNDRNVRGNGACLAPQIRIKQSQLPQAFDALGGSFSVIAKEGNRVQVKPIIPIGNYTLSVRRRF
jgi:hypothetical protein